ncbi:MAG: purine-binding chemotaxis protein CheW [Thermoleophilaceae bacterium]|jgi:purine-binding chemotaxis protein CheW|nr:purine-binding chemotaxis protein CheW [Thermoleophilaceae bacterium]
MAEETNARQLVVFSLGEEEYGLPVTQVQEIIHYTTPRAVSSDAAWIQGVISLRGKIIPVADLGSRLGLSAERSDSGKIVIVESGSITAGVIVDDVEEVLTIDDSQLDAVPASGSAAIDSIAKIDDRLIVVLDIDGLFGSIDLAVAA